MSNDSLNFYSVEEKKESSTPYYGGESSSGFPSPADDFKEVSLDLNSLVIRHKEATFYARVSGQSMIGAGLEDGDIIVIDKSLEPRDNKIAVCCIDGEFTVKRLKMSKDICWLMPENDNYQPIKIDSDSDFMVWGMVTYVIKAV
jgi:DNA polymerase V